jgi:hypothetical protein
MRSLSSSMMLNERTAIRGPLGCRRQRLAGLVEPHLRPPIGLGLVLSGIHAPNPRRAP